MHRGCELNPGPTFFRVVSRTFLRLRFFTRPPAASGAFEYIYVYLYTSGSLTQKRPGIRGCSDEPFSEDAP